MRPKNKNSKQRSSILIIALWSVCLLTTLAVILGFEVRQQLILVKRLQERDSLRMIAEAGVIKAAALLQAELDQGFESLSQKWSNNPDAFKDVVLGGGSFSVSSETDPGQVRYGLIDEESKININKATNRVMARLFNLLGLEELEAQDLSDSIVDWRDADSEISGPEGAEDSYYRSLDWPYEAKDAQFQVLDELLLIKGVNENNFSKIKGHITIYGNGRVNVNTAGKPVLMALGLSENVAEKILAFRNGKDNSVGTADDNFFEDTSTIALKISDTVNLSQAEQAQINNIVSAGAIATSSANFMVRSFAVLGRSKFNHEVIAVINRKGKILYWNEF